jgi:hypothetical protein
MKMKNGMIVFFSLNKIVITMFIIQLELIYTDFLLYLNLLLSDNNKTQL